MLWPSRKSQFPHALTRINILNLTFYESPQSQRTRVAKKCGEATQFNLILTLVLHFLNIMKGIDQSTEWCF